MSNMSENEKMDFQRFYVEGGDPGFNPEKNRQVVEQTIRETDKRMESKKKAYDDKLAERVEAAASYATYLESHPNSSAFNNPEKYFGKQLLAELHAKDLASDIQGRMAKRSLEGAISIN